MTWSPAKSVILFVLNAPKWRLIALNVRENSGITITVLTNVQVATTLIPIISVNNVATTLLPVFYLLSTLLSLPKLSVTASLLLLSSIEISISILWCFSGMPDLEPEEDPSNLVIIRWLLVLPECSDWEWETVHLLTNKVYHYLLNLVLFLIFQE